MKNVAIEYQTKTCLFKQNIRYLDCVYIATDLKIALLHFVVDKSVPTGTSIEIRYETLTKTWAAFSPVGDASMLFIGLVGCVNRSLDDFTK